MALEKRSNAAFGDGRKRGPQYELRRRISGIVNKVDKLKEIPWDHEVKDDGVLVEIYRKDYRPRGVKNKEQKHVPMFSMNAYLNKHGLRFPKSFRFEFYREGEEDILKPLVESVEGVSVIYWSTGEGDSYGPLTRVALCCIGEKNTGYWFELIYG